MAVENLRHAQDLRGFEHCAGEQSEALGVVRIIAGRGAVEAVTVEEWGVIYKVIAHTGVVARHYDRTEPVVVIKRNGDTADRLLRVREFSLAVERHIDAHL